MPMREHLNLLGRRVLDVVTGFEGVVTSVSFDLSGCIQGYVTAPAAKDDKEIYRGGWFDTKRLELKIYPAGTELPVMTQPDFSVVPGGQNLPALPHLPAK